MADPPPGAENGVEEPKTKKPSGNILFKSHIEISYKYFALLLVRDGVPNPNELSPTFSQ